MNGKTEKNPTSNLLILFCIYGTFTTRKAMKNFIFCNTASDISSFAVTYDTGYSYPSFRVVCYHPISITGHENMSDLNAIRPEESSRLFPF